MIPDKIFSKCSRFLIKRQRSEVFLNEHTHQLKIIHLHLYKQGFTSLTMDNYQLKNHVFPLSFHTPQKNNNLQLMTQQFGLKNGMLSYTALCIYWVTLLPATQQNIITSGNENHFNMHKNIVDIGNFTHKNLTHNEKAKQEKSLCKSLTNVFLIFVEAGTFLYLSSVESKAQLAPLDYINWVWISSKFPLHCGALPHISSTVHLKSFQHLPSSSRWLPHLMEKQHLHGWLF